MDRSRERMGAVTTLSTTFERQPRDPTSPATEDAIHYLERYHSIVQTIADALASRADAIDEPLANDVRTLFAPFRATPDNKAVADVIGVMGEIISGTVDSRGVYVETTVHTEGEFNDAFDTAINTDYELETSIAVVDGLVDDLSVPVPASGADPVTDVHVELVQRWDEVVTSAVADPTPETRLIVAFCPATCRSTRFRFRAWPDQPWI